MEQGLLSENVTLVLHAGKDYYEELLPLIEHSEATIEIPTEGMYIGERLSWYKENIS